MGEGFAREALDPEVQQIELDVKAEDQTVSLFIVFDQSRDFIISRDYAYDHSSN